MITKDKLYPILADSAYCFDFLSILDVKKTKNPQNYDNYTNFSTQLRLLEDFIGKDKLDYVMGSKEYTELFLINFRLYDLVDLAKKDIVKASEVDAVVYERFVAKGLLQKRFFPQEIQIEKKIGY